MKEEFQAEHYSLAEAKFTKPAQYQHLSGDSVPRSMSVPRDRSNKFLESSFLLHGNENSSHYTFRPSGFYKGPETMLSPPRSVFTLTENHCEVTRHKPKLCELLAKPAQLLMTANDGQLSSRSSRAEDNINPHQDSLQRLPRSMTGEDASELDMKSVVLTTAKHETQDADQLEGTKASKDVVQIMAELQFSSPQRLRQHVSINDVDSLEDDSMSDTESRNEEQLTDRYILEFLWDQHLSSVATENPALEAHDLASVREAFIDQIETTLPRFNSRWTASFKSNTGSGSKPSTSSNTSLSNKRSSSEGASSNHGRKRSRDDEDKPSANGNGGPPDDVGSGIRRRQSRQPLSRLACPFRKHDPSKYNLHDHRVCATTPLESIARLKQHLRTAHRAIHCSRCKKVFKTYRALDRHNDVPRSEVCEQRDLPIPDGMTLAMEEDMKGRWQSSPPQVFWGRIYQILFPNEDVPSSNFEEIWDTPSVRESLPPGAEGSPYHDLQSLDTGWDTTVIDDNNKKFFECVGSRMPSFIADCRLQSELDYTGNGKARQDAFFTNNSDCRNADQSSLSHEPDQQPNWDTTGYNGSSPISGHDWMGTGAQSDTSMALPRLSSTATRDLNDTPDNSDLVICPCSHPCTCLKLIGLDSTGPKSDLHAGELFLQEQEPSWDDELSELTFFNSSSLKVDDE